MKLTIELYDISRGDEELFKKLSTRTLSIKTQRCENYMLVTAYGCYDDLIKVIMHATAYRKYKINLL